MGRLVDTDELTEVMTSDWFINLVLGTNSGAAIKETFSDYIDRIPTAYDIEKVVAELEESMNGAKNLWDDDEYYIGCANAFESAIEIVKRGGIRD